MGEGFISFGHAVHVLFALDGAAAPVCRVQKLIGELIDHALAGARAGMQQKPANGQRLPAKLADLNRNLIVRATHAARLHLEYGLDVFHRFLKDLERLVIGFLSHLLHGAIKDALSRGALAIPHHRVNELLNQITAVDRIRKDRAARYESFAWHEASPFLFLRSLGTLGSVLRAPLLAITDTRRIERAANDVVANSGQIFDAAATHDHDGVLLQVVADSGA